MQPKRKILGNLISGLGIVLFLLSLFPAQTVRADTGPKPTMEFTFKPESGSDALTIVSGILYECDQADCSDAEPLKQLGPQGLRCDELGCNALAYGFSDYHRLEIQFSDGKTRQSNVFKTAGFDSQYTVTIRPDDLQVEAQSTPGNFPPVAIIVITCIRALIALCLVAIVVIFLVRRAKKN